MLYEPKNNPPVDSGPAFQAPSKEPGQQGLVVLSLHSFLQQKLRERGFLLFPIIPEQGLVLLYAPRGVGKTLLALAIALAIASGSDLFQWECSKPRAVLYIDGEMPATALQERLASLALGAGINSADSLFHLVTPDEQEFPLPNLAQPGGQVLFEPYLAGVSLVVIDNLACLCSAGRENETESWQPVQRWLLDLRRRGISVLVVHHAGKSGDQRGTSAREDVMDTVIALKRPEDYKPEQGARFEVHITKSRGLAGKEIAPFEAQLRQEGAAFLWSYTTINDPQAEEVRELSGQGLSVRKIADKTGLTKSKVHRMLKGGELAQEA